MPILSNPRFQQAVEACKRARDNMPPYPTALLESLGAQIDKNWHKAPQPHFRGWTWFVGGCPDGYVPNNASFDDPERAVPDIDLDDIYYIGMWVGRTQSKTHALWCVLPSMDHGDVRLGGAIDFGEGVIRIGQYTQQELDGMVRKGWDIMQQMIEERGRYQPEAEG